MLLGDVLRCAVWAIGDRFSLVSLESRSPGGGGSLLARGASWRRGEPLGARTSWREQEGVSGLPVWDRFSLISLLMVFPPESRNLVLRFVWAIRRSSADKGA